MSTSLVEQLRNAFAGGWIPILSGSGAADLFRLRSGSFARINELVSDVAKEQGFGVVHYSSLGCNHIPHGENSPRLQTPGQGDPHGHAIANLFDQLSAHNEPTVTVIDFADLVLPDGSPAQQDTEVLFVAVNTFARRARLSPHRLVLIDYSSTVNGRVERSPGYVRLHVGAPDAASRREFLERLAELQHSVPSVAPFDPSVGIDAFATNSGGLSLDALSRLSRLAAADRRCVSLRDVLDAKATELQRIGGDTLRVYPPGPTFESVGGLPGVRLVARQLQQAGQRAGVLILAGPPGTGKTLVVRALAAALGVPAVAMGQIRDQYVGNSERRFRQFLDAIRALSPCLVHIDEADQSLGGRDTGNHGDSGVSARLNALLWEFTSNEKDHQVLFVLTTNRPDLLDSAMISRSEVIPVLPPTRPEQVRILQIACAEFGIDVSESVARQVIDRHGNDFLVGRTIARVVAEARTRMIMSGREELDASILDETFALLADRTNDRETELTILRTLQMTTFANRFPWIAASEIGDHCSEVPSYLQGLLDRSARQLDREQLSARIDELGSALRRSSSQW